MSMISGLIDELNKSADEWNGSNMFELARMCRDAADTIWKLRDDLQRTNADNAKLRESVRRLMTQRDERLARAEAENAKLHALCRDMYLVVELLDMDGARLQAHGRDADWRTLKERYDELGVDA